MDPNDDDEKRQPGSFKVDDETNVYFLQQACEYHERLVEEENRPWLTRNPIHRDREGAKERLMGDYFDDYCTYTADPLPKHFKFFKVRPDATGQMSLNVIMKCTAAIRQLAYGNTPDAFDEYLQMSEHTAQHDFRRPKMAVTDWNDVYANPSKNMQRTWVERCEVQRRKEKEFRDRETHISLQQNLMSIFGMKLNTKTKMKTFSR
uniref:Reverse transcriptase domain-containing protein n=1 Tax=Tanacetum cinerariifolium TaxID=118510 RepID=A0A6L2L3N0_TANCI|nr:reverse transcriptase domain-containing protein [Tanacetum cinerariifolium]